jgi:hypothetical protein
VLLFTGIIVLSVLSSFICAFNVGSKGSFVLGILSFLVYK